MLEEIDFIGVILVLQAGARAIDSLMLWVCDADERCPRGGSALDWPGMRGYWFAPPTEQNRRSMPMPLACAIWTLQAR